MSEIIVYPLPSGANYTIPDVGDENWGQSVTDYLVAIPNGTLPTSGTFTLTGDVYFGSSFGLVSQYFKSPTVNPASAGLIRLAKTDVIDWRNNANSGNNILAVNSSDLLTYNGTPIASAGSGVTSITGTANQVIASSPTGAVTLSLPQQIAAASSPTFANLSLLSTGTAPVLNFSNAAGTHGVALGCEPGQAVDYSLTWPPTAPLNHTVLRSLGGGVLDWGLVDLTTNITGILPTANGGTGDASFTAYSVICGGTTSTGALQNVSGVGSSGQALVSNGASALPTWQTIGGSGTVNSGTSGQFAYYATSTNAVSTFPASGSTGLMGSIRFGDATNQLTFTNTANVLTISVPSPAASQTYTIPDVGGAASFVLTAGSQTIGGTKTLSGTTNLSGLTVSTALALDGSKNIVSVTNTGSGNNVLATSPTLTTPNIGSATASGLAMGANKITGLANGTASTDAAAFGQIKFFQAVQATSTTQSSITSSTFTACTNQSVVITPTSASNRVRITVSTVGQPATASTIAITLKRGTTELSGVAGGFSRVDAQATQPYTPISFSYIDSPATTSATTYQVFASSSNNASAVLVGRSDTVSVIIVEEIV